MILLKMMTVLPRTVLNLVVLAMVAVWATCPTAIDEMEMVVTSDVLF